MRSKRLCVNLLLIFSILFSQRLFAENEPLVYGHVPDFNFQECSGNQMQLSDLAGQAWVANFIFTRCQNMCPLMSGRMAELQDELAESGVRLVSFSVDPEHDTPEVLSEYAERFNAKKDVWFFLTGEKQTMWEFIQAGFQLGVAEPTPEELEGGAEPVMHSNRFVLVDPQGRVRGYYDSSEPEQMKQLKENALKLISGQE